MDTLRSMGARAFALGWQEKEAGSLPVRPAERHHHKPVALMMKRALPTVLVTAPTALIGLSVNTLVTEHGLSSAVVAEVTLATLATASGVIAGKWLWNDSTAWSVKPYRVANRPAVRFENAAGDYMKFERYNDGVSANWSTADGPHVLLLLPLKGSSAVGQFWTTKNESEERELSDLAVDLLRNESDVIRAWVETDRELIVWRRGDAGSAGIAQLGVLMRSWSPLRVMELVRASATKPVQKTVMERLDGAEEWATQDAWRNG